VKLETLHRPLPTPADAIPQDEHAVAEPALLEQFQVQPHTVREESLSTADDRGADDYLELVYQTSSYRLRGEFGAINADVVLDVGFEPPDRLWIELPLNARSCAPGLGQGPSCTSASAACAGQTARNLSLSAAPDPGGASERARGTAAALHRCS
jgi:hypothetical protein